MSSITSLPDKCCHYCHKVCQPQRCSRCKKVYYCSKSCQKSDWKLSHRRVCSSSSSSSSSSLLLNGDSSTSTLCKENTTTITDEETHVQRAAEELSHLLGDLSLDQMVEQFHRASDEIRRLQEEEEEKGVKERMKEHVGRYDLETEKQIRGKNIDSKSDSTRVDSIGYSRFELCDENQREPLVESSCRTTRNTEGGEQVTRYDTVPVKIDPVSVQAEQDPFMGQGPSSSNILEDLYNNYKLETWECIVEKLTFISTLIVTLVPSHLGENCENDTRDKIHDLPLQHLKIEMYPGTQPDEQGSPSNSHSSFKKHTRIMLQNTANRTILQHLNLPFHIISTQEEVQSSLSFEGNVLSMRLMYHDPHQSYLDNIAFESTLTALSPVEALNHLQCRSCHQIVVKRPSPQEKNKEKEEKEEEEGKGPIQSVFPLPVGYWDEITDYLTCFEGQPSIDFSSSSNNMVRKGVALEDDSLLVLNSNDLEHVCILAVEGYGEAMTPTTETISSATATVAATTTNTTNTTANTTVSSLQPSRQNATLQQGGNHDWHDVVGGVTLTCGQCCSILGYASFPDADDSSSCRLYKHRLEAINTWRHRSRTSTSSSLSNDQQQHPMMVEDCFQYNTIASFLGKELIRYAESKAIFTFLVFDQDGNGHNGDHDDDDDDDNDAMSQCLFIRVLSWNTMVARKRNQNGRNHLHFRRCVKVIYQKERDVTKYINEADNVEKKFSRFMGDECCPPSFVVPFATITSPTTTATTTTTGNNNKKYNQMSSTRSINLYLDSQEWNELHDWLQDASNFFPDSVSRATVMLKLGVQEENSDTSSSSRSTSTAKLSFLSL